MASHQITLVERLESTARWLTETPILERRTESTLVGSVSAGYDMRTRAYLGKYNEITGYALNTLLLFHRQFGGVRYLQLARQCARYLLTCQCDSPISPESGAFIHGVDSSGQRVWRCYSFDTAIVAHGLIAVAAETGDCEFSEAAVRAGHWLVAQAQLTKGAFRCYWDPGRGWCNEPSTEFSSEQGCLHAKHAIPLLKLYALTGDVRFREGAESVCRWVLELQRADGAFWANPGRRYVHTHAHCYATEGLLYAGRVMERDDFMNAALMSARWLSSVQCRDGALLRVYHDRRSLKAWLRRLAPVASTDVVAQAIRIWSLLREELPQLEPSIRRGLDYLLGQQVLQPAVPELEGAFYYQRLRGFGSRRPHRVVYTWPAQFAVQALQWQRTPATVDELY